MLGAECAQVCPPINSGQFAYEKLGREPRRAGDNGDNEGTFSCEEGPGVLKKTPAFQVLALRHCFTACRPRRPGLSFCRPYGLLRPSTDAPTLGSDEQMAVSIDVKMMLLLLSHEPLMMTHNTRYT